MMRSKMAVTKRTLLVSVLVLLSVFKTNKSDSDFKQNYSLDDRVEAEDHIEQDADLPAYKDIEPEKTIRDTEIAEQDNDGNDYEKVSTIEEFTTTEAFNEVGQSDDVQRSDDVEDEGSQDVATVDATESGDATLSSVDNRVYKHTDSGVVDIYLNRSNNDRGDATTQAATRPMDEVEDFVPRIADLGDDLDIQGQRSPKTENDEHLLIDQGTFDEPKPRPPQTVSKSTTLKSWLEDSWIRPPAGLLVPLRPMALNRALAVWNDLTVGGLNVSDIVIVGYDSNGVNWRSRHSLQPSSRGHGDRAVSEALSKLLLKYQGVNADSGDGTMRALTSAAKLVPYDSALFVVTDKGAGDPQRLPLALRALVEKRLKVYTIWTDPEYPSTESEAALHELRNISRHTEGDVLPYSLQVMDMDSSSNLASEADLQEWDSIETTQSRQGRLNSQVEAERFETLLVRRGGGEAISVGVPVENGVSALRIYVEGAVEHAVLYPPNDG